MYSSFECYRTKYVTIEVTNDRMCDKKTYSHNLKWVSQNSMCYCEKFTVRRMQRLWKPGMWQLPERKQDSYRMVECPERRGWHCGHATSDWWSNLVLTVIVSIALPSFYIKCFLRSFSPVFFNLQQKTSWKIMEGELHHSVRRFGKVHWHVCWCETALEPNFCSFGAEATKSLGNPVRYIFHIFSYLSCSCNVY